MIFGIFALMKGKPSTVLMVRPARFAFNTQTAVSNFFQVSGEGPEEEIHNKALSEFDAFVKKLRDAGIDVRVFDDTLLPHTPDSIFPNNWISCHDDGTMVLYPMLTENRRAERRSDIIAAFTKPDTVIVDMSFHELKNEILEGTGSIVFDYDNRIAYMNTSPRSNKLLLLELCGRLDYKAVIFRATDMNGFDIYHTNVLMCVGRGFAVVCTESITDETERRQVVQSLQSTGHEIIEITRLQMNAFAGNMYQLFDRDGKSVIVMSEQAFLALDPFQAVQLERYGRILHSPLYTIEKHGGGSARCMIADIRNIS
jgi:hypothetical protein